MFQLVIDHPVVDLVNLVEFVRSGSKRICKYPKIRNEKILGIKIIFHTINKIIILLRCQATKCRYLLFLHD